MGRIEASRKTGLVDLPPDARRMFDALRKTTYPEKLGRLLGCATTTIIALEDGGRVQPRTAERVTASLERLREAVRGAA